MAGAVESPPKTIEELYREHGARLWWALLAFTGDREIASDAEAEAFAQVIRRGDAVREPLAWVWKAAFRIAAGELKDRSTRSSDTGEPSYSLPEPAWAVTAALRELPPQQRAAILLHYYADRPIREIADLLGVSSATVGVHLHRGRNRLRDVLGEDDG
jgi:RNA polymerase sigma-70 factor (ECF subfamily)